MSLTFRVIHPIGRAQAYLARRYNETGNAAWLIPWSPMRLLYLAGFSFYMWVHEHGS